MQIKNVKCPKCGTPLTVKNLKDKREVRINCPKCESPLKVTFSPEEEPLTAHTLLEMPKKPSVDNGATQLAGNAYGATVLATPKEKPAKESINARLVFDDQPYFLEEGQNIIGRKGATSKATVQIATDDRYMSRQHCAITVTTLPDGTKKAVLSNYQNKNLTTIDGQEIETGDAIRLVNGNRITMGHTTVTFKV